MSHSQSKPTCLIIGGSEKTKLFLSSRLHGLVRVVLEKSDTSIGTAQKFGARVAIVFSGPNSHQLAHDLTEHVPGLQVILETPPRSLHSRVEKNGFNFLFDRTKDLNTIVDRVRLLCQEVPERPKSNGRRQVAAARFVRHLPSIQASLAHRQKLCDHLLESILHATHATRGGLFFADAKGEDYQLVASRQLGAEHDGLKIPGESEVAHGLSSNNAVAHLEDEGIEHPAANHLRHFHCNLLIPISHADVLVGWMIAQTPILPHDIDFECLETMAFFASESLRHCATVDSTARDVSRLKAGLKIAVPSVMILDPRGQIVQLSDARGLLRFRHPSPKTFRALACGILKKAIRQGLEGNDQRQSWPLADAGEHLVSVQRMADHSVIVFLTTQVDDARDVTIDRSVWKEAFSPGLLHYLESAVNSHSIQSPPLHPGAQPAGEQPSRDACWIKDLFRQPTASTIKIDWDDAMTHSVIPASRYRALECFWQGILEQPRHAVKVSVHKKLQDVEVTIVHETPRLDEAENPQAKVSLSFGLLLLIANEIAVSREAAAFGTRWTINLGPCSEIQAASDVIRKCPPNHEIDTFGLQIESLPHKIATRELSASCTHNGRTAGAP